MNPDDFEQQLRRRPIRPLPESWRSEIIRAAENAAHARNAARNSKSLLSTLLWPCPQAWAGLVAVWLVIAVMNFANREKVEAVTETKPTSLDVIMALKEQRQAMANLIESFDQPAVEPPKPRLQRPRSERTKTTGMA
jgi:glucose-6-phosphate isomerase